MDWHGPGLRSPDLASLPWAGKSVVQRNRWSLIAEYGHLAEEVDAHANLKLPPATWKERPATTNAGRSGRSRYSCSGYATDGFTHALDQGQL